MHWVAIFSCNYMSGMVCGYVLDWVSADDRSENGRWAALPGND